MRRVACQWRLLETTDFCMLWCSGVFLARKGCFLSPCCTLSFPALVFPLGAVLWTTSEPDFRSHAWGVSKCKLCDPFWGLEKRMQSPIGLSWLARRYGATWKELGKWGSVPCLFSFVLTRSTQANPHHKQHVMFFWCSLRKVRSKTGPGFSCI